MAALARLLSTLAFAFASPYGQPGLVGVSLRIPAYSWVATSEVAWRGGQAWFGVAVDRELRIYRWKKVAWVLDGTVELPAGVQPPGAGGGKLWSTSVTGG